MPLSDEQIAELLAGELTKRATPKSGGGKGQPANATKLPRPQQLGPLRYVDKSGRCVNRNCGGTTMIKVVGRGYLCYTHALVELNKMIIEFTLGNGYLEGCTCKAGEYSKGHIHTLGCGLYTLDKETIDEYL